MQWIPEFCSDMGLNLGQTFQKEGASRDDILTILTTIWKQADDIRCTPDDRLSFCMYVVEMGLGGWRPGELELKKYNRVKLAWVRDPVDPSITRTICWATVDHNKLRRLRIERDQRSRYASPVPRLWFIFHNRQSRPVKLTGVTVSVIRSLSYAISVVPSLMLCLTTMFTIRAVRDNAFQAGYTTCDEVLNPGTLADGTDFVELRWKDEFMSNDKYIMPMNYRRFLDIWNEVRIVAGCRSNLRPYSVRVGAVGRLDGKVSFRMQNTLACLTN